MGLLNRAAAFINGKLGTAAGLEVTYSRGATNIDIAAADGLVWAGEARFAVNDQGGARIVHGERVYMILADALGVLGEPEEGDRVYETVGGEDCTFEVAQPGTGDPAVRWSDPARTRWRVYTKRVE